MRTGCRHDPEGGYGESIACPKCNAELVALLEAPTCGLLIGVENGVEFTCTERNGHFGDCRHVRTANVRCDHPGYSATIKG